MQHTLNLEKMRSVVNHGKVNYFLALPEGEISVNELIGKEVSVRFTGRIFCTVCGQQTRKSFGQGFCYNCFVTAPEAEECVLNPERCKAHLGVSRDMVFSESHCLIPHYVYLSFTSNIKVGVTRQNQIPTRWVDQGATAAIILAQTPNRHTAGMIEVFLKKYFSDKTQWNKMLQDTGLDGINLLAEKERASAMLPAVMQRLISDDNTVVHLNYPVVDYPQNPVSINLAKKESVTGILKGIKGQYLILDSQAFNVRRHTGFEVVLTS